MMLLTISFYKSDGEGLEPKKELICEGSTIVGNIVECRIFFELMKDTFKAKNPAEGKYSIVRETSGIRKIKGYKNWKESDYIVIKDKYTKIKPGDSISFPSGVGKLSRQTAFVEFVDDEGVGLDFIKIQEGASQEYWTFEELEEFGII